MPAVESLCNLFGINHQKIQRDENFILEAELFIRVYEELQEFFKEQYRNYFCLFNFTQEMESIMLEANFIRFIIKDILLTEDYTLEGIAYYIGVHQDIVYELATGSNSNPSALLLRKIIELHRSVRSDLYQEIANKITAKYLAVA